MVRSIMVRAVLTGLLLLDGVAAADEVHRATGKAAADNTLVSVRVLDLEVLDQDGKRLRFKSDVVRDRLVVIDQIYTSCPVVCPILSSIMAGVQESLGDRLGKEVLLVSISVDPTTDVPARLKEYAQRWRARPGWLFLTGQKPSVDGVLKGLNVYAADFTDHSTVILVGDGRHDRWTRLYGFPSPRDVLARLDQLRAWRQAAAR